MFKDLTEKELLIIIREWERVCDIPTSKTLKEVVQELLVKLKAYDEDEIQQG